VNTAISLTGSARYAAIAYAQEHGTVSVRALDGLLARRGAVDSNVAAATLYRLAKEGLLERVARGVYALGPASSELTTLAPPVIVLATLDKLEADYPDALAAELHRRGWTR